LSAIPDGVAVLHEGEVYFTNAAFLDTIKGSLESVIGQKYVDFIHPEDRARFQEAAAGSAVRVRLVRMDKVLRFAELSVAGAVSFEGRPSMIVLSRDTTDDRVAQEQLARADKLSALGSLAAGVAHEVNNPLAYVTLSMQQLRDLIAEGNLDPEVALMLADEVIGGVLRIRGIVGELRGFSRSDRLDAVGAIDVAKAVTSATNIVQNEIRHRARLVREHEDGVFANAREGQLVQVFVNVLVNAAQAIPEGDGADHSISVRSRKQGEQVEIVVQDTGEGIPAAALERVFDPFFTRKPDKGSGLGLAISKRIIDAFGGSIGISSQVGQGTTVTITLPATTPLEREGEPRMQSRDTLVPPRRILVIDDEPAIGKALQRTLRGHDVTVARSGAEGLQLLAEGTFELILCDLMMPGMAGPEVYRTVCAAQPELAARFVFMTGGAFTQVSREFLEEVAPPILYKPFDAADLMHFVRGGAAAQSDRNGLPPKPSAT
jgi:two-component system, cell cycle sensor histidine kinase and response regulator CckA